MMLLSVGLSVSPERYTVFIFVSVPPVVLYSKLEIKNKSKQDHVQHAIMECSAQLLNEEPST